MYRKYCSCGRKIKVLIRGRWVVPRDDDHTECRKCYRSLFDSRR